MEKFQLLSHWLWTTYPSLKDTKISGRYLSPNTINSSLKELSNLAELKIEGYSVLNKPIYSLSIGTGDYKILGWSQMHGNESTTTKAVLDVFSALTLHKNNTEIEAVLSQLTLKVIIQLNPDGCEAYTRFNANNIDLNRDAQDLSQPESKVLRKVYDEFQPLLCLNLHDQRTIYNVRNTKEPATVSFLAPSADYERTVTDSRAFSMKCIAAMCSFLKTMIPGRIGRYDDSFNLNCVGDMFQNLETPTILFEAGHSPNDYEREDTRRYIYGALMQLLFSLKNTEIERFTLTDYELIPENDKQFLDVIIKDLKLDDNIADVGLLYEEQLKERSIQFLPKIEYIGKLDNYLGHLVLDAKDLREAQINNETWEVGQYINCASIINLM